MAQTKLKTFGKRKLSVFELIVMVLLIAYCVAVVALLAWGFMASFRTDQSVAQRPWAMFEDLTIDNYLEVFDNFKTSRSIHHTGCIGFSRCISYAGRGGYAKSFARSFKHACV